MKNTSVTTMENTDHHRHGRRSRISAAVLCLGALIFPALAVAPAEAAVTKYNCTLTSYKPYDSTPSAAHKQTITLRAYVKCKNADTKVQVRFQAWEADGGWHPHWQDDKIGGWRYDPATNAYPNWRLSTKDSDTRFSTTLNTVDWDDDNRGDFYHTVQFRIVINGTWSEWSSTDVSPQLVLPWN
jgi:hypothetical protein